MKDRLFFSIIIPTYNRAPFIERTLRSALDQSYSDFEIIIVDDGSTDNTEEVVRSLQNEKIRYFKIRNSERGAARNYGMDQASGDYVTFLDSDDLLYGHYLTNANETLRKFKFPPFFHLAYEIRNEKNKLLYRIDRLRSDDTKFITRGNPLSALGVFIRKDVIEKMRFNEDRDLAGSEDWEFWLRIIANYGIKTDNRISACLVHHDDRSVMNFDEERLYKRKELALKYAFEDPMVQELYAGSYKMIDAYADGYISLHLALAGNNSKSISYLRRSFVHYPFIIFSRRFVAILKHLVINTFH
jgi:glycosyltransferase involved in cell wall biosynthesis